MRRFFNARAPNDKHLRYGSWIYSKDGKTALQGKQTELDVSGLSSGLYFVKFSNGTTIKFIKK